MIRERIQCRATHGQEQGWPDRHTLGVDRGRVRIPDESDERAIGILHLGGASVLVSQRRDALRRTRQ